jgi:hypothetical protein
LAIKPKKSATSPLKQIAPLPFGAIHHRLRFTAELFELFISFASEHFLISGWRVEMSHHSTLHAFFLAAQESGYTEFKLRLVKSPKGRVEFCISPREHSEMSVKFEVRGNMVRAAASDMTVVPADDTDFGIYGGTRSGEAPLPVSPSP